MSPRALLFRKQRLFISAAFFFGLPTTLWIVNPGSGRLSAILNNANLYYVIAFCVSSVFYPLFIITMIFVMRATADRRMAYISEDLLIIRQMRKRVIPIGEVSLAFERDGSPVLYANSGITVRFPDELLEGGRDQVIKFVRCFAINPNKFT